MRRAILLLCVVAIFLVALSGRWLVVNDPQHSDVIMVLAGETDVRPALGIKLLKDGYAPRMILNVPAGAKIYQWTETELAQRYVEGLPEISAIQICPIHGLSTQDEARDAGHCLTGSGRKVLLVTSDYHSQRALSIFKHELPDRSFSIAAASDPQEFGVQWWQRRQWAKTNFYEGIRLLWWYAVDRWR